MSALSDGKKDLSGVKLQGYAIAYEEKGIESILQFPSVDHGVQRR